MQFFSIIFGKSIKLSKLIQYSQRDKSAFLSLAEALFLRRGTFSELGEGRFEAVLEGHVVVWREAEARPHYVDDSTALCEEGVNDGHIYK